MEKKKYPVIKYNKNGKRIYYEDSTGYWERYLHIGKDQKVFYGNCEGYIGFRYIHARNMQLDKS